MASRQGSSEPLPGLEDTRVASTTTPVGMSCTIPLEAPSMNSLLQIIWHQHRLETRPEIRLFRTRFKQFLPVWKPSSEAWFAITFRFHEPWLYANGKLKHKDAPNLIKCCLDALCEHYGIDDARVFHLTCEKVLSPDPKIEVTLESLEGDARRALEI